MPFTYVYIYIYLYRYNMSSSRNPRLRFSCMSCNNSSLYSIVKNTNGKILAFFIIWASSTSQELSSRTSLTKEFQGFGGLQLIFQLVLQHVSWKVLKIHCVFDIFAFGIVLVMLQMDLTNCVFWLQNVRMRARAHARTREPTAYVRARVCAWARAKSVRTRMRTRTRI